MEKKVLKNEGSSQKVILPFKNEKLFITAKDIIYVQAERSYSRIVTTDNKNYLYSKSLKQFELENNKNGLFIRIHKSFLVNLNHIKKIASIDMTIVLSSGKCLPISRRQKSNIKQKLKRVDL